MIRGGLVDFLIGQMAGRKDYNRGEGMRPNGLMPSLVSGRHA
jgi:hypothetical protein